MIPIQDAIASDPAAVFDALAWEVGIEAVEQFCRDARRTPLEEHLWAVRVSAAAQRVKYVAGEDA